MMAFKITPSVGTNLWLKRLDTRLNEPINQKPKSPKFLSKQIRKFYHETLGTSVINSPMLPPSLSDFEPHLVNVKLLFILVV